MSLAMSLASLATTAPVEEDPEMADTFREAEGTAGDLDQSSYEFSRSGDLHEPEVAAEDRLPMRSSGSMAPHLFKNQGKAVSRKALAAEKDDKGIDPLEENDYEDDNSDQPLDDSSEVEPEEEPFRKKGKAAAAAFASDIHQRLKKLQAEDEAEAGDAAFNMTSTRESIEVATTRSEHGMNQQRIMDTCLELRIRLEPLMGVSYRLPSPEATRLFRANDEASRQKLDSASAEIGGVLEQLLQLQGHLLRRTPELKAAARNMQEEEEEDEDEIDEEHISSSGSDSSGEEEHRHRRHHRRGKKRRRAAEEHAGGEGETDADSKRAKCDASNTAAMWEVIDRRFRALLPHVTSVTDTWHRKSQLLSGVMGGGGRPGSGQRRRLKALNQTVMSQVEALMEEDNLKELVMLSQVRPPTVPRAVGATVVMGEKETRLGDVMTAAAAAASSSDPHVYTDTRFYAALLKRFLESQGGGESGIAPKATRKRGGRRKNVDKRATKGRKLKYVSHPKLVNFMAPVRLPTQVMDTSRLFASLLAG